ncbi:PH domain-containing protein [Croceibacterium mercuriale]|uniref:PH domain-containing protein n=1 Tax=Croceibacterium mercuriale TaxID=1572751 RepID=UPI00068F8785|nr:PH domain-containing protein [Croceibacterium mercuriale]
MEDASPYADEPLTPLDPGYVRMVRLLTGLALAAPVIGAIVLEAEQVLPPGAVAVPVVLAAGWLLLRLPLRRWRARGYVYGADALRVVRGLWWRRDITVPFGRVQHLDVTQGPLERLFGLGTLVLHTAGNHNSSVALPGLAHPQALAMRDTIRAHVALHSQ